LIYHNKFTKTKVRNIITNYVFLRKYIENILRYTAGKGTFGSFETGQLQGKSMLKNQYRLCLM